MFFRVKCVFCFILKKFVCIKVKSSHFWLCVFVSSLIFLFFFFLRLKFFFLFRAVDIMAQRGCARLLLANNKDKFLKTNIKTIQNAGYSSNDF